MASSQGGMDLNAAVIDLRLSVATLKVKFEHLGRAVIWELFRRVYTKALPALSREIVEGPRHTISLVSAENNAKVTVANYHSYGWHIEADVRTNEVSTPANARIVAHKLLAAADELERRTTHG